MSSILQTLGNLLAGLVAPFRPRADPVRIGSETELGSLAADADLSVPGKFQTCRGLVFRHGRDSTTDERGLEESRWIAFEGVRLRVSSYREDSEVSNRLTFCGKDAQGCGESRDWAARLLRANGIAFPNETKFVQFCRELGWTDQEVETMLGIYSSPAR